MIEEFFDWGRTSRRGYEVSTKGDTRFSPLVARLKDGRTIEEAYQLDVKGYRVHTDNWYDAKGKKPLDPSVNLYIEYLKLWQQWATENPALIEELRTLAEAEGRMLTDMFATSDVCQARALAHILNN